MAEMNNALNDGAVPSLVCNYNNGYVRGGKWYLCRMRKRAIVCAACVVLCCDPKPKEVFEVTFPDNIDDVKCDCGNKRCYRRFCYFFPGSKDSSNDRKLYKLPLLRIPYVYTEDDKKKIDKFYTENTRLLLARAAFSLENKILIDAVIQVKFAVLFNLDAVSTMVAEMALEVDQALGLMTQVQDSFLLAIKDLASWEILKIAMMVKTFFTRSVQILQLARNRYRVVGEEGRKNLELLREYFNSTFTEIIMDAFHTKAASFDMIKVFSRGQYKYYLKYVDVKRETKARMYLGNWFGTEYDWKELAEEAGSSGFSIHLCTDFENELCDEKDEVKRERIKQHLIANKK